MVSDGRPTSSSMEFKNLESHRRLSGCFLAYQPWNPKDGSSSSIQVLVDMNGGIPKKITLECGENRWKEVQDYEKFPFKCQYCHEAGHILQDCSRRS
jgi:hypothetical protein